MVSKGLFKMTSETTNVAAIREVPGIEASDDLLLRRCRLKDRDACNALLERYNRKIYSTAYRILGEHGPAEDAVQETLLNVYRGLASFRGDAQISTWISRITVNVCLGMMRRSKRSQLIDLEEDLIRVLPADPTRHTDPEEYARADELERQISQVFARMSDKHSKVVRLHDMEGYTIPEIARLIGCPVGTVKSRLFYGRQEFKELFSSADQEKEKKPLVH